MNALVHRAALGAASVGLVALAMSAPPVFAVGTPAGTTISNQATVNYADANGNPLSALSNVVTTTVSQVASVTVNPDRASSATPGDIVYYGHVVTNGANGDDTIDLTAISSNAWVTALFADNDSSGTFTAGDTLLTDTDGDGVVDTGLMAHDATKPILARLTVPAGTANGVTDTLTVTGTSSFNVSVSDNAIDTTSITAPNMSVVKSVLPVGPQPPSTVLTYTILVTNNGAGNASTVAVTDPVPANTTYVAGSITLDGVSKTDAGFDDEGDFNVATSGAITVSLATLAPGASRTVTFQVRIN